MTPDRYTNQEFLLDVGNGHQIYVWDWGNKDSKTPFIAFHGGPGGGTRDRHREPFDPLQHRVIFFDQRGCGRSLPYGALEHNTTQDLLEDAVKILDHLHIRQVRIFGSSWGSTLAFLFTLKYPKRVTAVVASAVYLASKDENEWIDKGLYNIFYPETLERYLEHTPEEEYADPTAYHFKQILGSDPAKAAASALAVQEMEYSLMHLDDRFHPGDPAAFDPAPTRIYAHYMTNNCFLKDKYLMQHAEEITVPVWMVHGRYDIVCPPHTAYELHQAIPGSKLFFAISNHRAEHETWNILRGILAQFD
jgi:proline iminopeptidase